jgi:hypothetical protein
MMQGTVGGGLPPAPTTGLISLPAGRGVVGGTSSLVSNLLPAGLPSGTGSSATDIAHYIAVIRRAFEGVLAAAQQVMEKSSEPGQYQVLLTGLGSKLEEFDSVCDEIYQLAEHTYSVLKQQEGLSSALSDVALSADELQSQQQATQPPTTTTQLPSPHGLQTPPLFKPQARLQLAENVQAQIAATREARKLLMNFFKEDGSALTASAFSAMEINMTDDHME